MDALEKQGLANNTILVFTSDHGEMFGAHGRRAKYIFYEEAARIPFLMRWPKHIPRRGSRTPCLGTPDIMPTVLSLMNLPIPKTVEGVDLSHEALGRSGASPEAAHMQGMGTTAAWTDGTEWRALRDHEYTYAVYRGMAGNSYSTIEPIRIRCEISQPIGRGCHPYALPRALPEMEKRAKRHLRELHLVSRPLDSRPKYYFDSSRYWPEFESSRFSPEPLVPEGPDGLAVATSPLAPPPGCFTTVKLILEAYSREW